MTRSEGIRLLIVDDDKSIREALRERLAPRGYSITTAASGREALERLRAGVDVALLDLALPHGDGLSVLRVAAEEELDATIIVITAYGTIERAVEAMRLGAYDFLPKPFAPGLVEEALRRAEERSGLRRLAQAQALSADESTVIAGTPAMVELFAAVRKAAASDATVLLCGESGTGKEILARELHRASPRAAGPFVALNCAALPESLLESELFGHEKGAFTGAHTRRVGRIEAAHGGTLFLDEIGDTPPAFQARLLRVLQERAFARVGSSTEISVDLRVVAATHRRLRDEIAAGRFREDLYFRLNVIALDVPPLRERVADIAPLARAFAERAAREAGRSGACIAPDALRALEAWSWPGNVRELENAVERASVLSESGEITLEDLPPEIALGADPEQPTAFHARVEVFRASVIREALAQHAGSPTQAARALGLQRTYLARLIRKYGL
ncbi:MAG TPA: sigma-54 dependent transcriptional regulator [Planctomycetota bacterium]|nr:sigma-54 dependent transcriptional regulator [Planctomycetota bacterium]